VEQLRFLENAQRTLGQVAIQWLLAEPAVTTVLPNIYNEEQLKEFGTASDTPELTTDELQKIKVLVENNFGITDEPPMMYKGNMEAPAMDISGYRKQLDEQAQAEEKQLQPA
jgi:diketogulonate reductase-like aldo/keto reductase